MFVWNKTPERTYWYSDFWGFFSFMTCPSSTYFYLILPLYFIRIHFSDNKYLQFHNRQQKKLFFQTSKSSPFFTISAFHISTLSCHLKCTLCENNITTLTKMCMFSDLVWKQAAQTKVVIYSQSTYQSNVPQNQTLASLHSGTARVLNLN